MYFQFGCIVTTRCVCYEFCVDCTPSEINKVATLLSEYSTLSSKIFFFDILSYYDVSIINYVLFGVIELYCSCNCISTACFRSYLLDLFLYNCTSPLETLVPAAGSFPSLILLLLRFLPLFYCCESLLLHMVG